jgi:hypothetical protein
MGDVATHNRSMQFLKGEQKATKLRKKLNGTNKAAIDRTHDV